MKVLGLSRTCPFSTIALLAWCCSVTEAFLLDGESGDETLRTAFQAIEQLNIKLNDLSNENLQLKQRLLNAEAKQGSTAQTLSGIQSDLTGLTSKVSRDYIWFDDWILAFRATKGIGKPVYDAWVNKGHHDDDPMIRDTMPCGCSTINGSLSCDRHYRSRLLDTWPSASIDQVRLVLYNNGVEKEHVTFSGTGSDYMNWFSQSRIIDSSWADLKTATSLNYFSIAGDTYELRRFFISQLYHRCPGDIGWMLVKDKKADTCSWATVEVIPDFLYSPSNHEMNWENNGASHADVMAIFVKFRETTELNEVCLN